MCGLKDVERCSSHNLNLITFFNFLSKAKQDKMDILSYTTTVKTPYALCASRWEDPDGFSQSALWPPRRIKRVETQTTIYNRNDCRSFLADCLPVASSAQDNRTSTFRHSHRSPVCNEATGYLTRGKKVRSGFDQLYRKDRPCPLRREKPQKMTDELMSKQKGLNLMTRRTSLKPRWNGTRAA